MRDGASTDSEADDGAVTSDANIEVDALPPPDDDGGHSQMDASVQADAGPSTGVDGGNDVDAHASVDAAMDAAAHVDANAVEGDAGRDAGCAALPYYLDSDGDGAGGSTVALVASCTAPPGTSTTSGDCDDTRNTVYPGAADLCDDLDNDCDGSTDPICGTAEISGGEGHSCGVRQSGEVLCWGDYWGNLTSSAQLLPGVSTAVNIASGGETTCVVHTSGDVECWGASVPPSPVGDAVAVAVGYLHACALLSDRSVTCWSGSSIASVGGLNPAIAIAAAYQETCVVHTTGTVSCWYSGGMPAEISGVTNAVRIAIGTNHGGNHKCALLGTGEVQCWGSNWDGQIGNGQRRVLTSVSPTLVAGVSGAIEIALGHGHSCALLASGTIKCWGDNFHGQLGNGMSGAFTWTTTPVDVLLTDVDFIGCGDFHCCAIDAMRRAYCWGSNDSHQIGNNGYVGIVYPTPQMVR